ncbi:MAG TPA: hypothetical protein VEL47_02310 [Myxococcota bacterium]|nr:hypothetical protein [Myxococcota bacterium]
MLMKRMLLSTMLTLALGNSSLAGSERTMAFGVSATGALLGALDVVYQIKLRENLLLTIPVHASYDLVKAIAKWGTVTRSPLTFYGGLGAKYLPSNNGLNNSFYLEGRLTFGYSQFGFRHEKLYDSMAWMLTPTVRLGWDWYLASGLYLSLGAGIGLDIYVKKKNSKLPKATDFLHKRFFLPPRSRAVAFAMDGEFLLGYSW